MNDVHALSGAYAVDALDDLERIRFERHLAECAECRYEVDSMREATGLLTEVEPVTPPLALRDRLLADIATVRPLPPLTQEVGRSRTRRFPVLVAAAAAVVALLGVGGVVAVTQPWEDGTSNLEAGPGLTTPKAVTDVLQAQDARSVTRTFEDGSKATVTRSKSLRQAVIVTEGMADPGDGLVYELWLPARRPDEGSRLHARRARQRRAALRGRRDRPGGRHHRRARGRLRHPELRVGHRHRLRPGLT